VFGRRNLRRGRWIEQRAELRNAERAADRADAGCDRNTRRQKREAAVARGSGDRFGLRLDAALQPDDRGGLGELGRGRQRRRLDLRFDPRVRLWLDLLFGFLFDLGLDFFRLDLRLDFWRRGFRRLGLDRFG